MVFTLQPEFSQVELPAHTVCAAETPAVKFLSHFALAAVLGLAGQSLLEAGRHLLSSQVIELVRKL